MSKRSGVSQTFPRLAGKLIGIIEEAPGDFAPVEFAGAADLSFDPDDWLQRFEQSARLLVKERGGRVTGDLLLGQCRLEAAGEITRKGKAAELRLIAYSSACPTIEAFALSLPISDGDAVGHFAAAAPGMVAGGLLTAYWWQADDPFKGCGEFLYGVDLELSDQDGTHRSKFRLYRFEKCEFVVWYKPDGTRDLTTLTKLELDTANGRPFQTGGVTITPLKTPLSSAPAGGNEKRTGHLRLFYIEGCAQLRVVQYAKTSKTFKPPKNNPNATMPPDVPDSWHRDGTDPYAGTTPIPGKGITVVSDIPAAYENMVASAEDVRRIPEGATVTYTWSLETFVHCNGALFGWIKWGGSVTFTKGKNGKLTPGAPTVDRPVFNLPNVYSQSDGNKKP